MRWPPGDAGGDGVYGRARGAPPTGQQGANADEGRSCARCYPKGPPRGGKGRGCARRPQGAIRGERRGRTRGYIRGRPGGRRGPGARTHALPQVAGRKPTRGPQRFARARGAGARAAHKRSPQGRGGAGARGADAPRGPFQGEHFLESSKQKTSPCYKRKTKDRKQRNHTHTPQINGRGRIQSRLALRKMASVKHRLAKREPPHPLGNNEQY